MSRSFKKFWNVKFWHDLLQKIFKDLQVFEEKMPLNHIAWLIIKKFQKVVQKSTQIPLLLILQVKIKIKIGR
jgi:hypothetical protein